MIVADGTDTEYKEHYKRYKSRGMAILILGHVALICGYFLQSSIVAPGMLRLDVISYMMGIFFVLYGAVAFFINRKRLILIDLHLMNYSKAKMQ